MESVVGIFSSRADAQAAARALSEMGFGPDRVEALFPDAREPDFEEIPTDDAEQPGVARAVGAVVGGAAGGAAGLGLGVATASMLLPGIGAVTAVGLAAAALFGAGGAAAGAAAANRLEEKTTRGISRDELYLYEDALTHGRSIVFVFAESDEAAGRARAVLAEAGAESLDAARDRWWLALRDVEKRHYESSVEDFVAAEPSYRSGFIAALQTGSADGPDEARQRLSREEAGDEAAFRLGWESGRRYRAARLAGRRLVRRTPPNGVRSAGAPRRSFR
jgi:hypothetical protein